MGIGAYKDKEGRTRYRVTFRRDGRRLVDERLPPGTSREKAEQYHARIVSQWFERDRLGIQEIPLISSVIRRYEREITPTLRSPRFPRHCIAAIAPHAIGKTLAELPQVADALIKALRGQAPATIAHRVSFLRTLASYAVKWRMADRDYGTGIERPKFNNERQFYVSKAELAKILRHASKQVRWACWQLFYTGMRRSELFSAVIRDGCYVIAQTKNGDPRIVPVPVAVRKITGAPNMSMDGLSKAFRSAATASGYKHLRLHDLRHSAASQLLNAGTPLPVVGMILGHRDTRSTLRYSHLATDTARAWMNFAARGLKMTDWRGSPAGTRPEGVRKKAA